MNTRKTVITAVIVLGAILLAKYGFSKPKASVPATPGSAPIIATAAPYVDGGAVVSPTEEIIQPAGLGDVILPPAPYVQDVLVVDDRFLGGPVKDYAMYAPEVATDVFFNKSAV